MTDSVPPVPTSKIDSDSAVLASLIPPPPEPWPELVDGAALLDDLASIFRRFVFMPEYSDTILALWTIHTYAHNWSEISPVLAVVSPEKRCGKTTLLDVLHALVRKPLMTSNITQAALYSVIEKFYPTLLIDEGDTFIHSKELIGILNSGHRKASAVIVRRGGESYKEVVCYSTWAPKSIASIRDLPDTLMDRAIVIRLRRKTKVEQVDRFRTDRIADFEPCRRRIVRWVVDNIAFLKGADPAIPDDLQNRVADNWRPLFAIADAAGGRWSKRARHAALVWNEKDNAEPSPGILLLGDLRTLFRSQNVDRLATKDILAALTKLEGRPWASYQGKQRLSAHDLGVLLRPYGIKSDKIRLKEPSEVVQGYKYSLAMKDAFTRYLLPDDEGFDPPERIEQPEHGDDPVISVPDVLLVPKKKGVRINLETGEVRRDL